MSSSLNNTPIFREYIAVKPSSEFDEFPDIVSNVKEFHFILGIGTENHTKDAKGTGYFKCTWNVQYFNKERVREIKEKYKAITDVKVILSFGGLGDQNAFNPSENNLWISRAYTSIKAIIQKYYQIQDPKTNTIINTIDGIDINYEYITPDDRFVFTKCIGKLISKLKKDSELSLNTFSISPSELVQIHYYTLYLNYPSLISWINYQFYLHHISSKDHFVMLYDNLVQKYPDNKFLPGVSTDPDTARNMDREHFIAGITELNKANPLAGAFVWNANDSKALPRNPSENPYFLEKTIQDILNTGAI